MELLRTLLSIPGNREKMIAKAGALPADVLVLDLEDSVPAPEKAKARTMVKDSLAGLARRGQKVFVRINSLASGHMQADLEAVVYPGLDGISFPKPKSSDEVRKAVAIIERLESERGINQGHIKIIPWIETAKGLLSAFDIASASPRVIGLSLGAEDFTLDTGLRRSDEGEELLIPRIMMMLAAKAAEVCAIDTPYNDFNNEKGLLHEALLARNLGFDGKFVIHPSQIEPVNRLFRPTPDETMMAKRIDEAFKAAEAQGFASTSINGKMIDIPQAQRARKLLSIAQAVAQKEKSG